MAFKYVEPTRPNRETRIMGLESRDPNHGILSSWSTGRLELRAERGSSKIEMQASSSFEVAARLDIDVRTAHDQTSELAEDVKNGLGASPKAIPPKYFYDETGSKLFEAICETDEYYPTRTELGLLERHAPKIVEAVAPRAIVELGSGSARKIRTVLAAARDALSECTYVPFDVSEPMLRQSGEALLSEFEGLSVRGIVGDYDKDLEALPRLGSTLWLFLGGTIGNFEPVRASEFLANIARHMHQEDHLLVGTDLVKDAAVLNRAYNDAQGVTERFNKNVLSVINQHLDADFDLSLFEHVAFFNTSKNQIEMYLESTKKQVVRLEGLNTEVPLEAGERILTEISRKFTRASAERMLADAGLQLDAWMESDDAYFALSLATRSR